MSTDALKELWPEFNGVIGAHLNNAKPMILIGQDNWSLAERRKVTAEWNGAVATRTPLGWVVHGNVPPQVGSRDHSVLLCCSVDEATRMEDLHSLVKEHFKTENFGVLPTALPRSKNDKRAQEILESTSRRIGEAWEVGLLWKSDDIELPQSRAVAEKRLRLMERKMDREPEFKKNYEAKIQEYIEKSYARKLTKSEAAEVTKRTWYLPHFGVWNSNKPDKMRLVFDAASKSGGMSLNDCLLTGPDLYNPLQSVLWKFREQKVAIGADIRDMFHRVKIKEEDQGPVSPRAFYHLPCNLLENGEKSRFTKTPVNGKRLKV